VEKAALDDAWRVENQLKKSVETIAILTGLPLEGPTQLLARIAPRLACGTERGSKRSSGCVPGGHGGIANIKSQRLVIGLDDPVKMNLIHGVGPCPQSFSSGLYSAEA
jgi:hypothetical protein